MIEGQRPIERRRLMRGLALKDARALLCSVGSSAVGQLRRREIADDIQIVRLVAAALPSDVHERRLPGGPPSAQPARVMQVLRRSCLEKPASKFADRGEAVVVNRGL